MSMDTAVIGVFLTVLIGMFVPAVQARVGQWLRKPPARVFVVPAALVAFFAAALATTGPPSPVFLLLVAVYCLVPTVLVYLAGRSGRGVSWLDFISILALWLPVEVGAGKILLMPGAYRIANHLAHGTAVMLGLLLFLCFRRLPGMKYNPPRSWRDLRNAVAGFLVVAPVLIFLGLKLGFMGPFRLPPYPWPPRFAYVFLITLVGVAIPEELLFRALIQNWLMQRFGNGNGVLFGAALIFGAAHLNNHPGFPNWRYMILATIAGFVYGKVFQKSSTILSSAGVHAFGNTMRHLFFG